MNDKAIYWSTLSWILLLAYALMDINTANNAIDPAYHSGVTDSSDRLAGERTEGVSIVQQVSSLLALPSEILLNIANPLSFGDWRRLSLTSRRLCAVFTTEERLKVLSARYYGSATETEVYRKIIENREIPAVPGNEICDPLLRLAYHRYASNKYLASLGSNFDQTCVMTLSGHEDDVTSILELPDGRLVSRSYDRTIKIWNPGRLDQDPCLATLRAENRRLEKFLLALPDSRLVCGSWGEIYVWDLNKLDQNSYPAKLEEGHDSWVQFVSLLSDGRLVSCDGDGTIKVWDLSKPSGQQCVITLSDHGFPLEFVRPLSDGRLVSRDVYETIKVWDLSKPDGEQCVATIPGPVRAVRQGMNSLIELPDGRLVFCSGRSDIKVWDLSKPDGEQCVATLRKHAGWVESIMLLPDGRLVSCSFDRTIKLWDMSKLDQEPCVATLIGHKRLVKCVTVLPDGRLASCSFDRTIKLWDLSEPDGKRCVATLNGYFPRGRYFQTMMALVNGRLAFSSNGHTIKVLDLSQPDG